MEWRVVVRNKPGVFDAAGAGIRCDIADLGIKGIRDVNVEEVYNLIGELKEGLDEYGIRRICDELLADKITQDYSCTNNPGSPSSDSKSLAVEIAYNPGVMDPVEESVKKAVLDMGIKGLKEVRTRRRYIIYGSSSKGQLNRVAEKLLYNKLIQHIARDGEARPKEGTRLHFALNEVEVLNAGASALRGISERRTLSLNLREMEALKGYFRRLGRNPTDCELETIAQTWSEHCVHKTFKGVIEYVERSKVKGQRSKDKGRRAEVKALGTRKINNLLKSTIMKVTKELNKPWCVSVFADNSGVIRFDEKFNVCFKVETHNHPSALEPYGGAGTGVGGVIRDVLGTGLGARPIANTDVFCFGPPDFPYNKLPEGMLHPKRVMKGVVAGVRDYGNRMGIPTVNGAILFDERYIGNPLVFCGDVGIMPKGKSFKAISPKEAIVLVGGRTGRDGIHGATFSSAELTHSSELQSSGAVQIGNPITEKKLTDVLLRARDRGLYTAITDCGAGGLSSAVGEMGSRCGAKVDLERVPLKYKGLSYSEIWISESQERMVLSVPKKNLSRLIGLFKSEDVEATVIGEFTDDLRLRLFYEGKRVCDLDMDFLHNGMPEITKKAKWSPLRFKEPELRMKRDFTKDLLNILSSMNVASKEWVIRQYDHEVQGGSVLKPLVGANNDGPSDAAILRPRAGENRGIIIACGINPRYTDIDPYWMAASCIDEALRQVVAVGGSIERTALLDNFCWGNPDKRDRLGGLVRAAIACYDIAKGYGVPFISGKDSLNNEYRSSEGEPLPIPGTLLVSAISVMTDVRKAVSMDLKAPGDLIYIVGRTRHELGGSQYYALYNHLGCSVPCVEPITGRLLMTKLSRAHSMGLVRACHDCSEGGLAVSCAEMAFAGDLGVRIDLSKVSFVKEGAGEVRDDYILFSESNTRFIVEVAPQKQREFERTMKGASVSLVGRVTREKRFIVYGLSGKGVVSSNIRALKEAWQAPLRW